MSWREKNEAVRLELDCNQVRGAVFQQAHSWQMSFEPQSEENMFEKHLLSVRGRVRALLLRIATAYKCGRKIHIHIAVAGKAVHRQCTEVEVHEQLLSNRAKIHYVNAKSTNSQ